MGKRETLNGIVRREIPGGDRLMNLKFEVQRWRSRETSADIAHVYDELCKIHSEMLDAANAMYKEERAEAGNGKAPGAQTPEA